MYHRSRIIGITPELVIFSYVGLLFFISNEGIKGTSPVQNSVEIEMTKRAVPLQDANFDEIQINKNLLKNSQLLVMTALWYI